jgi:hypothetical protein
MSTIPEYLKNKQLTYKLKHVFCNDPECRLCAEGNGHGPYWHASYKEGGQTRTILLGKDFTPYHSTSTDRPTTKGSSANRAANRFNIQSTDQAKEESVLSHQERKTPDVTQKHSPPPSKIDFKKDLRKLQSTYRADNLKTLYRKLIKKYHPDKYPHDNHVNSWMAEINSCYDQHQKSIRYPEHPTAP